MCTLSPPASPIPSFFCESKCFFEMPPLSLLHLPFSAGHFLFFYVLCSRLFCDACFVFEKWLSRHFYCVFECLSFILFIWFYLFRVWSLPPCLFVTKIYALQFTQKQKVCVLGGGGIMKKVRLNVCPTLRLSGSCFCGHCVGVETDSNTGEDSGTLSFTPRSILFKCQPALVRVLALSCPKWLFPRQYLFIRVLS